MITHLNRRRMRVHWRPFACYSFMLTLLGVHVIFQYAVVPNAVGLRTGSDWAPAETASGPDLALACEQWIGRRSLKLPKGFVGPEVDEDGGGGDVGARLHATVARPAPATHPAAGSPARLWKGGGDGTVLAPVAPPAGGGRLARRPAGGAAATAEDFAGGVLVATAQQKRFPFPRRLTNDDTAVLSDSPEAGALPAGGTKSHLGGAGAHSNTFRPPPSRDHTPLVGTPDGGPDANANGPMEPRGVGYYYAPPMGSSRVSNALRAHDEYDDTAGGLGNGAERVNNRKYVDNTQYAQSYFAHEEAEGKDAGQVRYDNQHVEGALFVRTPNQISTSSYLQAEARHHGDRPELGIGPLDLNRNLVGLVGHDAGVPLNSRNRAPDPPHGAAAGDSVFPGSHNAPTGSQAADVPGGRRTMAGSHDVASSSNHILTHEQFLLPGHQVLLQPHGSRGDLHVDYQDHLVPGSQQRALPGDTKTAYAGDPNHRRPPGDSGLLYQHLADRPIEVKARPAGAAAVVVGAVAAAAERGLPGRHRLLPGDHGVVPSIQSVPSNGVYRARDDATNPHHQRYQFTCANIQHITIKRKLGQGVTKQVYLGVHDGRKVAVKMVTRNVIDVLSCMKRLRRETADLSLLPGEKHKCYTLPNMKLMKEILLLNQLDHPNLLRLQGYCVRSEETDSTSLQEHGIVAVYEYGLRFYISNLREWPWRLRLRTATELADLLEYLQQSPLGSLRISDFKDAHFLLKDGRIKLTDLDDVTSLEPTCQPNNGPKLDLKGQRTAAKVCGYGLKCVAGICPGYNAVKNLDNFNRLFFSNMLLGDTPDTEEHMARLRTRLESLSIEASELKRTLYHFLDVPFLSGYS